MDLTMAEFVNLLGPRQVIDRYSLVLLPVGFIKIMICTTKTNLFTSVSEFKESEQEGNLDIKITAKGYLTVNDHVIKGDYVIDEGIPANAVERGVQILRFDKTSVFQNMEKSELKRNEKPLSEILQICVYVLKKNKRGKSLLGMVHIAMDGVNGDNSESCNFEAWYKVFPRSSFLAGYPTADATTHYVSPPSSSPSLVSNECDSLVEFLKTLSFSKPDDNKSSSFSSSDEADGKTSFAHMARLVVKLMQRKKEEQRNIDDSSSTYMFSSSSLTETSARRSSVSDISQYEESSYHEKPVSNCDKINVRDKFSINGRTVSLKGGFKSKFHRRFSFPHSQKSLKRFDSKFQRSEEIICDSSAYEWQYPSTIIETSDEHSASHDLVNLHGISANVQGSISQNQSWSDSKQFRSVDSRNTSDESSQEIEENNSVSKQRRKSIKFIPSMLSWMRSVHYKARRHSLPFVSTQHPNVTAQQTPFNSRRKCCKEIGNDVDHDYAVLKSLISLEKSQNEIRSSENLNKLHFKESSIYQNESIQSKCKPAPDEKEGLHETPTHMSVLGSIENPPENSNLCQEKRNLFSKRRSQGFEEGAASSTFRFTKLSMTSQSSERGSNDNSLLCDSDDDYFTCSERLSCTNLSTLYAYSTISTTSKPR